MKKKFDHIGIDFGSKLAGTTALAYWGENQVNIIQSEKKKDADAWLSKEIKLKNPSLIGIDAPLSLPGVYRDLAGFDNYFYRQSDRELKAMSPMFLGGLTARAMRLRANLSEYHFIEIYPAILAQRLHLKALGYKQKLSNLPKVLEELAVHLPFAFQISDIKSWHAFDALLAYWSVYRFRNQEHDIFGDPDEGQIVV